MDARLALGVILTLTTTALLAYVGVLVSRRRATGDARSALRAFGAWWSAAALVIFLAGAHTMLGLLGVDDVAMYTALAFLTQIPLAVGLCALMYYLLYVYTGASTSLRPLAIGYAAFLAFGFYFTAAQGTRHLEDTGWDIRLVGTPPPATLSAAYGIVLLAPALFVIVAYGLLLRRVREPAPRRRLLLTSIAFIVWFAPVLAGFLLGLSNAPWFPLVYQVPGALAAGIVVYAHAMRDAEGKGRDPQER